MYMYMCVCVSVCLPQRTRWYDDEQVLEEKGLLVSPPEAKGAKLVDLEKWKLGKVVRSLCSILVLSPCLLYLRSGPGVLCCIPFCPVTFYSAPFLCSLLSFWAWCVFCSIPLCSPHLHLAIGWRPVCLVCCRCCLWWVWCIVFCFLCCMLFLS